MPEDQTSPIVLTPQGVLQGTSPLVLTATLQPVAGLDRFQPAGFPEIGHVIYKAPRKDGCFENVCIVDSPASMANHLESVCAARTISNCMKTWGACPICAASRVIWPMGKSFRRRNANWSLPVSRKDIDSTYFLEGKSLDTGDSHGTETFAKALEAKFGIKLPGSKKAHPPAGKWWDVFGTIFRYDPNALVHGVLFPQYQIKIARFLTAHLEAFGATRVDRSGVKFDRLGKTTSGQPIFAVDEATAGKIRATYVALLRSFGRTEKKNGSDGPKTLGLAEEQKEFLAALALWKIDRLLGSPFRYRSGCHLELLSLKRGDHDVKLDVDIKDAIKNAVFRDNGDQAPIVTDIYWPHDELYRETKDAKTPAGGTENNADDDGGDEDAEDS